MGMTFDELVVMTDDSLDQEIESVNEESASLMYRVYLDAERAAKAGRSQVTVMLRLDETRSMLFQTALTPDFLAPADVALAVAACNAFNDLAVLPTALVNVYDDDDEEDKQFDLRFRMCIDVDAGDTPTVRDAIRYFPNHVYLGLTTLRERFGL